MYIVSTVSHTIAHKNPKNEYFYVVYFLEWKSFNIAYSPEIVR